MTRPLGMTPRNEGSTPRQTIAAAIRGRWNAGDGRYSEIRAEATSIEKVEMSHIWG